MRTTTIGSKEAFPFVTTWNGTNSSTATGLKVNADMKQVVISQIGAQAAALFESDFVNYNSGYILCQNIPDNLQVVFTSKDPTVVNNFRKTIRFIVVRMPSTFIGQKGNLSSNYQYGEQLKVSVSYESLKNDDKGKQVPTINGSAVSQRTGPITSPSASNANKGPAGVVYLTYRDSNMIGRTLKSQSGGGGGVGVWS